MSSKRTFCDCYRELWELLDKPKLRFWQRMRAKQLLNQMLWKWGKENEENKENEELKEQKIEELTKIVEGYREAKNVICSLNPVEWGDGFHFNVNMILNNVENR